MKTLQLAEAKANFSSILRDVQAGDEVAIADEKKKEAVAVIIPYEKWKKSQKRQLGTLQGKMSVEFAECSPTTERRLGTLKGKAEVIFAEDFSMSDEELINS